MQAMGRSSLCDHRGRNRSKLVANTAEYHCKRHTTCCGCRLQGISRSRWALALAVSSLNVRVASSGNFFLERLPKLPLLPGIGPEVIQQLPDFALAPAPSPILQGDSWQPQSAAPSEPDAAANAVESLKAAASARSPRLGVLPGMPLTPALPQIIPGPPPLPPPPPPKPLLPPLPPVEGAFVEAAPPLDLGAPPPVAPPQLVPMPAPEDVAAAAAAGSSAPAHGPLAGGSPIPVPNMPMAKMPEWPPRPPPAPVVGGAESGAEGAYKAASTAGSGSDAAAAAEAVAVAAGAAAVAPAAVAGDMPSIEESLVMGGAPAPAQAVPLSQPVGTEPHPVDAVPLETGLLPPPPELPAELMVPAMPTGMQSVPATQPMVWGR